MNSSKQCCRLCSGNISTKDECIHIFDNVAHNNTLAILVQHYGIEVHVDDGYSNSICMVCWSVTDNFHKLYELVKRTEISVSGTYVGDDHHNDCSDDDKNEIVQMDCPIEDSVNIKEELVEDDGSSDGDSSGSSDERPIRAKKHKTTEDRNKGRNSETYEQENQQIRDFFSMNCELCDLVFRTVNEATLHYKSRHNKAGYLTCCGKKFNRRCKALDHIQHHLNPEHLKCELCGKSYSTPYYLRIHMVNHENAPTEISCSVCQQKFRTKMQVSQHFRRMHFTTSEEKKFGCDICGKFFLSKSILTNHIRGVHENAFGQMCHICAKTFKSKQVYKMHLLKHLGTEQEKFQCNICGAWLKNERGLRSHVARHTDPEVRCTICNKQTPNRQALQIHMRYVHLSEAKHKCTLCEKSFKKPVGLREHMASHTGVDLYACPYCTKTFKSNANMYSHRKKEHFELWTQDRHPRYIPQLPSTATPSTTSQT